MCSLSEEQLHRRVGDSLSGLNGGVSADDDDDDLDEESVSLANELLPEYYDIAGTCGSVHSHELYPMERRTPPLAASSSSPTDTLMIVRDLVDRVERLTRENSWLKQMGGNGRSSQQLRPQLLDDNDTGDDYLSLPSAIAPLPPRKHFGVDSDDILARHTPSYLLNGCDGDLMTSAAHQRSSGGPAGPHLTGHVQRVTFSEPQYLQAHHSHHQQERAASDSTIQNDAFRARVMDAIERHREAVDELRDLICSELTSGVYGSAGASPLTCGVGGLGSPASRLARSRPGMVRWCVDGELMGFGERPVSPAWRVNLRKPVWFRDLRTND